MKTIQILPSLDVGGVERGVIDLARAMKRRGEDMAVISSGGPLVAELHKIGIPHYQLPVHKKSLASLFLVNRIAEIIQKERADLVHARSRVPAWLAWFACRKTQVPFVTTCHGYYSTHFLSRVMGWGKRVIVISRVVGRHMIDDFKVPPDRIRLIYRGIDLNQFRFIPDKYDKDKRVLRIVNIGRLSPIKGHLEFLKAVHLLRRELPNIEVWIVGSESKEKQEYTEKIRQTMDQLGLSACVKLAGKRRDIPEILAESDLLVLSTLVPEAFGRVIIEAGAVGTAVVATKVGGVTDVLDHGENGLLVPPGDVQAMSEAMLSVLRNRHYAGELAHNLRRKVEAHFSLELMADQTLAVYREVKQEKKILILKLGALGDIVLATPSFRMIRERFPGAHIALLADKKLAPVISACPYLDEVIPVDRDRLPGFLYLLRIAKKIRDETFDFSVDLQNSKWTHLLAYLGGIRKRYGFRRGYGAFLLNKPMPFSKVPEPPVKNQFRILGRLGVQKFDDRLELEVDGDVLQKMKSMLESGGWRQTGRPLVGFVAGSSPNWPTKRWPAASFRLLGQRLVRELNCGVLLIGSAQDRLLSEEILWPDAGDRVGDLTGRTSPREIPALIKLLDLLVTGDTAPLHVAAAVGTPVVALFGPTDPRRHMPPCDSAAVLVKHLPCQPCYKGKCHNREKLACLKKISVEEVFEAVKSRLSPAAKMSTFQ